MLNFLLIVEFIFWVLMIPATLYIKKKTGKSISKRIQDFLPKWADYIVLISIIALIWWQLGGLYPATIAIRYLVLGHWFWNEE